jgi:hypothetical protein
VAVVDPVLLDHPPCLHYCHLPLDHCPPLEVAHPIDLYFHHLELDPHLGLVEMLAWKMMKGKCALGPFLSILVIKCPTQMFMC